MATIVLSPSIAAYIGAPCNLDIDVRSVGEAVSVLKANFPQFLNFVSKLADNGIGFMVRVGNMVIGADQIDSPIASKVCRIYFDTTPCGAGGNSTFGIIAGIALIGIGIFSGGIGFLGMSGTTTALLGGALLLGALFGQQKSPQDQERSGQKSNIFSRPQQTVQEGGRMPIVYGLHLAGWTIIAAIVKNYN